MREQEKHEKEREMVEEDRKKMFSELAIMTVMFKADKKTSD